jgi:hypothetical protein
MSAIDKAQTTPRCAKTDMHDSAVRLAPRCRVSTLTLYAPCLQVVVGNLQAQLMDATKSFQSVLKLRNENIKGSEDRRKMFSSSSSAAGGGPSISAGSRSGAGPDMLMTLTCVPLLLRSATSSCCSLLCPMRWLSVI